MGVSDGVTSQVTIISDVERRRAWTDEQKRALVAAANAQHSCTR